MPKKGVKTVVILSCLEHGGCEGFGLGHGFSSIQHSFRGIYCGSFNPPVFLGRKLLNSFCFTEESNDVVQIWSHFEVFFFLMTFLGCQNFHIHWYVGRYEISKTLLLVSYHFMSTWIVSTETSSVLLKIWILWKILQTIEQCRKSKSSPNVQIGLNYVIIPPKPRGIWRQQNCNCWPWGVDKETGTGLLTQQMLLLCHLRMPIHSLA
jgi:hypothetical protein